MTIIKNLIRIVSVFAIIILLISYSARYIPPSSSIVFPLAGLIFPILWMSTLIFLIVLLLARLKWYSYITIFSLLVTLPLMLKYFNLSLIVKDKHLEYSIINLNTFGLRFHDSVSDQLVNQGILNEYINKNGYSVACFQEYPMKGAKHAKFYENLKSGLALKHFEMSQYHWDKKYTDYILLTASKYPIVKTETLRYNSLPFAMYTHIRFPEGIVRVYNVHLQSIKLIKEKELLTPETYDKPERFYDHIISAVKKLRVAFIIREKQSLLITESMSECPYQIMVAGDLNDTPVSYAYRKISQGLKDASAKGKPGFKHTYKLSDIPLQIDYILYSPSIKARNYRVIDPLISDHYAISTSFNLPDKVTRE